MPQAWGYASDKRIRHENQDHFGVFEVPLGLLAVVCDGMGGHVGGAVASAIAVREIHAHMSSADGDPRDELQAAIELANTAVYDRSRRSRRLMGMGTTAVAALRTTEGLFIAHVGDSRAYFSRDGEAEAVTRDHTMVNLFVDAELLSPEDAASHPEAHVLARSLGVERAVEVDVQDALPFEAGDTVILCSDGVSGFIKEGEFAAQDWREPQESIEAIFKLLRERDSDDNATMVVITADANDAVVPMPLTEPPEVPEDEASEGARLSSVPTRSSPTIAPLDFDEQSDAAPPPLSAPSPQIQYEEIGAPPPMDMEIGIGDLSGPPSAIYDEEPIGAPVVEEPIAPEKPVRDLSQAKPVGGKRTKYLIAAGLLLSGVGVGSIVLFTLAQQGLQRAPQQATVSIEAPAVVVPAPIAEAPKDTAEQPAPAEAPVAEPDAAEPAPAGEPVPAPVPAAEVVEAPKPATEEPPPEFPDPVEVIDEDAVALLAPLVEWAPEYDDEATGFVVEVVPPPSEGGGFYIHAQKPDMGRTGLHRPETYVNVPPGGTQQIKVVQSARDGRCGESMTALHKAIDTSIDYASLYTQVWSCYNLGHQRKLFGVAITDDASFEEQLVHFEGERSFAGFSASRWGAPAESGIEHRIEEWAHAEGEHNFPIVILDLVGAEQAAMDLAGDLLIEAEAAAAFGRLARPNATQTDHWARRVYVTALGLTSSAGEMVSEHQPDTHARVRELLNEATRGGLDNPSGVRLPPQVKAALLAGLGKRKVLLPAAPKPKPTTAVRVAPTPEPEDVRPVIYQGPPKRQR